MRNQKMKAKGKPTPIIRPPDKVLPSTTTHEENLVTQGQRDINSLWEHTQARVAISVVVATVLTDAVVTIILSINRTDLSVSQLFALTFLHLICLEVIREYFRRTNHSMTGGVPKGYKGR